MTPQSLGSRYQLEEKIGEGGLGVVWRGSDVLTGAAYAIKVLRPEHAQDPDTVARFVRERNALLRFRHPNVVRLHDMIVEGDRLALVMELISGGDLAGYRRQRGGTLAAKEASELMAQVSAALAAAHAAGIVHRDLKPANILLDAGEVRLTDFGIAQVTGEPTLTTQGVFLGTLHYLAPEVIQGGGATPACDVYAVGVTLYELLAGHVPFSGQAAAVMYAHLHTAPERPDGIPDASWQLVSACLDKVPAGRPGAAEVEQALRGDAWTPASAGGWQLSSRWQGAVGTARPALWGEDTVARDVPAASPALGALAGLGAPQAGQTRAESGADGGADGTARAGGGAPGGGANGGGGARGPRRSRFGRGAWAGGGLALLAVAGVLAVTLAQSPGSPHAAGPAASVTATERVTAAGRTGSAGSATGQSPGAAAGAAGASPAGAQPSAQPGSTPGASQSASAGRSAGPTPVGSTPGATAGTSAPQSSAPASGGPSITPPTATSSASATPSTLPTPPVDTAWQCGPTEPATLYATGKDTGQTLQACIRVHNGKLSLHGVLVGAVASWKEQIVLVLKDAGQADHGVYYSPVCTASSCAFTIAVTPPSRGQWTVLPQWDRFSGNYQSTGAEAGFVSY
jgi:serine/threonine-protein kinase